MLFQKKGFPEEGELLLCTITKVRAHSVFVNIDEYGISGMIHISEIAPGRIRNIRDYVKEGKKVVCVVLNINKERGHVDLSLRRVNELQKKKKVEYIKQQQKSEKIIEHVAKKHKIPVLKYFNEVSKAISKDYDDLVVFFKDVVNDTIKIKDYDIKHPEDLEEIIKQRIKPPEVKIEGVFSVKCYAEDGLEIIKKAFSDIDSKIMTSYIGGGKYHIEMKGPSYKEIEEMLNPAIENIIKILEDNDAEVSYQRKNKKK